MRSCCGVKTVSFSPSSKYALANSIISAPIFIVNNFRGRLSRGFLSTLSPFLLLLLFLLDQPAGLSGAPSPASWTHSKDYSLTVLHTNDMHARFEQINKYSAVCKPDDEAEQKCYGGIARIKTQVDHIRARDPNVVFLDAGDQYQGTMWFYEFGGNITAHFMNLLNYDAMCLGNHEFDDGVAGLVPFLQTAKFPVLASNIELDGIAKMAEVKKRIKLHIGGELIGIVGYITKDTPILAKPGDLVFLDEVESVQKEVDELMKEGVNKIIALGHAGYSMDKKIAKEVKGVDIVVGGHTNTFLYKGKPPSREKPEGDYPTIVKQDDGEIALVVQAYAYGKYLGYLQATFDPAGRLSSWKGNPILLDKTVKRDPEILKEMLPYKRRLDKDVNRVIGRTSVLLNGDSQCRQEECNLGNLITDAMVSLYATNPEPDTWNRYAISVLNSGAIRTSIAPGNITTAQLMEVLPFKNDIDIIEVSGGVILTMLEHSVENYDPKNRQGKFLQYSGMKVTFDLSKPNGQRVAEVLVRCTKCLVPKYEPLEKEKIYNLSTSNFLIKGGDGYTMIKQKIKQHLLTGNQDVHVLREHLEHYSPIITGVEGRIQFRNQHVSMAPLSSSAAAASYTCATLYLAMIVLSALLISSNQMLHWTHSC